MPGIALPVLNDGTGLRENVARAALLHSHICSKPVSRDMIDDGEMARVAVYNHNVVESVAPAVSAMSFSVQPDEAVNLEGLLTPIKTSLAAIQRSNAIIHNFLLASSGTDLEIVPFSDGADPTKEPHSLPALTSLRSVYNLSDAQARAYYEGYVGTLPHALTAEDRRRAILFKLRIVDSLRTRYSRLPFHLHMLYATLSSSLACAPVARSHRRGGGAGRNALPTRQNCQTAKTPARRGKGREPDHAHAQQRQASYDMVLSNSSHFTQGVGGGPTSTASKQVTHGGRQPRAVFHPIAAPGLESKKDKIKNKNKRKNKNTIQNTVNASVTQHRARTEYGITAMHMTPSQPLSSPSPLAPAPPEQDKRRSERRPKPINEQRTRPKPKLSPRMLPGSM
ncbi:hypothetical protein D9615_010322 [Tricholomella constricta]|uniref:Mug135-like C-terminal domain-containing protein n=1 Tax=Tricholomella constricta TaxID=117010 RepID=A0A8H5LT75_9AGAR|nr:hypothetical protein D9615_010322 [Tricholomella constricta]